MTGLFSWKSNYLKIIIPLIFQLVSFTGCSRPPADFVLSYDFRDYDKKFNLDESLEEVSGMTYLGQKKIALVQDEKGVIYTFSLKSNSIVDKIKFTKEGDFEGLAKCGESLLALTSNGRIYEVVPGSDDDQDVEPVKLSLAKQDELEGFCYHPKKKNLLLVYKATSSLLESDARSIYSYKKGRSSHSKLPYYTITNQKIARYAEIHEPEDADISKLVKDKKSGEVLFQPSGIAIHPLTGNAYLVSGVNELLMVVDMDAREIVHMHRFDKDELSQPEGITFDGDGDLYISSEKGSAKKARILRFEMKN